MSLLDKLKRKFETIHKLRDPKRLLKASVSKIEKEVVDSGIIDDLKAAGDEIEEMVIAMGLETLADLIRDGKEGIPELKDMIKDILDDTQEYIKKLLD